MQQFYLRIYFVIALVVCSIQSFPQQKEIDSLKFALIAQKGIDRVHSLNELSWYYKNIDIDSAFLFSKQAINEATGINDKKGILSAYNALANVYDGVGMLDSSEYFHKLSLEIALELNDSTNIASSYNNLGIVYDLKGHNEMALEVYFKALTIHESLNTDPYSIAMVLGNIGVVYKKQKQYASTLEFYQRALAIYQEVNSAFGIMVTQGNIGSVLIHLKQYQESILISNQALEGYTNAGYARYVPYIEHNLAVAHDSLGQSKVAEELYKSAIKKHSEAQNFNEVALTCISYCDYLYRLKDFEKGLEIAQQANKNAMIADAVELEIDAIKYLAKFNFKLGNNQLAYLLLEKYTIRKDSLLEENGMKQILELQTKYKTAQQERTLLTQTLELEKKGDAIKLQIMLIVVLFLVLLIVVWWFQARRKRQKIMSHLAMNLERNRIAMDLHDHVGAELTLVSSKIDVRTYKAKENLEKEELMAISDQIRNVNATLRETVWSIQHETILVKELLDRVETYVFSLFDKETLLFQGTSNFPGFQLSPQIALNLYRISQEAVTNCFKYSEASKLNVELTIEKSNLQLQISDNGKGFDREQKTESFGLKNMKQRALALHGNLEISAAEGEGVAIQLQIPLKENN